MLNDDESKTCVKDLKGSLETLLANLHATPGPGAHQIPSPYCEKSSALVHERGRPENPLFCPCFQSVSHTDMRQVLGVSPPSLLQGWQESSGPPKRTAPCPPAACFSSVTSLGSRPELYHS